MRTTRFLVLLAALLWIAGCSTTAPDPLTGWKVDFDHQPDQAIVNDYQDYIQKLPSDEKNYVALGQYFEDGTGQHAVRMEIALNGTDWAHILIYNKDNKRIKVIKYVSGHYRS